MKATCTQENLQKGLSIVSHTVGADSTLPVLSNVLIESKAGRLRLAGTDLETGTNTFVRGKVDKEGAITIPARLFSEYISSLPKKNIDIELKEKVLSLKCGRFKASINGIDSEEFPLIPRIKEAPIASVNVVKFREFLQKVAFAAATDESRPELAGVNFEFNMEGNKVIAVSTDSYRLSENILTGIKVTKSKKNVIVPAKTALELVRVISSEIEGSIDISVSENQIMFHFKDLDMVSRLIEGQYPDYKQIIPDNFQTKIIFAREDLVNSIKTISLFSRDGSQDIKFEFNSAKNETLLYASTSQVGKNSSKLEAKIEGETAEVIFNSKYVLDGLANIDSKNVIFESNGSNGPAVLREEKNKNYTYIIMPIKQ